MEKRKNLRIPMKNLWVDIADGVEFSQGVVSDVSRSLSDYGPQPVVKIQPNKRDTMLYLQG